MSTRHRRPLLLLACIALPMLAACGNKGDLFLPPPPEREPVQDATPEPPPPADDADDDVR